MKKYSVYIEFKNGQNTQFETNTDIRTTPVVHINGANMIITEEHTAINKDHVEKIEVVEL